MYVPDTPLNRAAFTDETVLAEIYKVSSIRIVFKEIGGISSAGRASALHAEGQRFDPVILHQSRLPLLNPVGNHIAKVIALLFAMSN